MIATFTAAVSAVALASGSSPPVSSVPADPFCDGKQVRTVLLNYYYCSTYSTNTDPFCDGQQAGTWCEDANNKTNNQYKVCPGGLERPVRGPHCLSLVSTSLDGL